MSVLKLLKKFIHIWFHIFQSLLKKKKHNYYVSKENKKQTTNFNVFPHDAAELKKALGEFRQNNNNNNNNKNDDDDDADDNDNPIIITGCAG